MGRYLEALQEGEPFSSILETLDTAAPLAGGTFESVDDTVAMWTQADAWAGGEPAYEEAADDLGEALATGLIDQSQYDEAFAIIVV